MEIISKNWSDYSMTNVIINTKYLSNDEIRNYYVDLSKLIEDMVNKYVRDR